MFSRGLDLGTFRHVPWDDNVPFFLGEFVWQKDGKEAPFPLCPRQVLKRVLKRAKSWVHADVRHGIRVVQFLRDAAIVGGEERRRPGPDHLRHVRLFAAARQRARSRSSRRCSTKWARSACRSRGLHTETGPGVYEAAILFSEALEQADRAILFKTGAKEIASHFDIMPSFMAKWSQQYPGCSGHVHQSLSDGKTNRFYDPKGKHGMSKLFESYLAGQVAVLMEFAPMFWPTINSYKRLVDGFWAPVKPTWGVDNRTASFRVIPGSPKSTAPGNALPRRRRQSVPRDGRRDRRRPHGVEKGMKLTAKPITGTTRAPRTFPARRER
jgi:glutamine synthetase